MSAAHPARPRRRAALAAAVLGAGIAVLLVAPADQAGSARNAKAATLFGVLLGKNEIAADGKKRAGDLDGRGTATAVIDTGQLCFGLTVKDIDKPIAAHIHKGNRGAVGAPVVNLTPPTAGDPGASSGCVAISDGLASAIRKNPHKYYWNVHTEAFPGGALRGQVFSRAN